MPDLSYLSVIAAGQAGSEEDDMVSDLSGPPAPGWFSLIPEAEFRRWSERMQDAPVDTSSADGPAAWNLRIPWDQAYAHFQRCLPEVIALRPALEVPLTEMLEVLQFRVGTRTAPVVEFSVSDTYVSGRDPQSVLAELSRLGEPWWRPDRAALDRIELDPDVEYQDAVGLLYFQGGSLPEPTDARTLKRESRELQRLLWFIVIRTFLPVAVLVWGVVEIVTDNDLWSVLSVIPVVVAAGLLMRYWNKDPADSPPRSRAS